MDTIISPRSIERAADPSFPAVFPKEPSVSLILPVYNEAAILEQTLSALVSYMDSLGSAYEWELIVVNDGSTDPTGRIADSFARRHSRTFVLHHQVNFGLGQALQFAFRHCHGDYVITLDSDLSYAPHHIGSLLETIRRSKSKVVMASPYMPGGSVRNVPWLRKCLSLCANRFLSITARGRVSTLTGLVRVYDGNFLRSLNLKSCGMEINTEILHKAMLLGSRIEEIPGHLIWRMAHGVRRRSSMNVWGHTAATLLYGFLFRPTMFFILPGVSLMIAAACFNLHTAVSFLSEYRNLHEYAFFERASAAAAAAYHQFPHIFIIGAVTMTLAVQLLGLGLLALQSKSYFEELFHLGSKWPQSMERSEKAP